MELSDTTKGFLHSLMGTFLLSTNFVTAKYGLRGFNPETFSLVWTSAAVFYAFIFNVSTKGIRKLVIPSQSVNKILILGIFTGAGMLLTWAGLSELDPTFQSFIYRFQPALNIGLAALFLGERILVKEVFPFILMVAGGLISFIGRWDVVGIGVILTLLAIMAVAGQMLIAKERIKDVDSNVMVFYRVLFGAIVIAIWTFSTGKADFHVELSYWLITLLGALLGPTLSWVFTFRSYQYWELSRSSIVLTIQPLFVFPMAYVFLGQLPEENEILGGIIILIGAMWLMWVHYSHVRNILDS